jgi:ferric-dicitrate binding protein FerR (iron transport regulator)
MNKLFSKYLQSVCSPEEFQQVMEWVVEPEHEKILNTMMKASWDEQMREETAVPGNPLLWEKIRQAIVHEEQTATVRKLGNYKWLARVAAVLIVGLLVSNLFLATRPPGDGYIPHLQTVTVPNGARSNFSLPDGSKVWLNSGSTLSWSSDFNSKRLIELEGEAYFEVVKSEIPFFVNTSLGQVEVTGTSFNVKSLAGEEQFETTVEEGSVNVYCNYVPKIAGLKAGQQARLLDGHWELNRVETEIFTSWKDGKIIFRREYLPEVAKRLERWYHVSIELDNDPRLSKIHYTGTLEMESFSEVLELLEVTASINYTYNDKTRVIKITHR